MLRSRCIEPVKQHLPSCFTYYLFTVDVLIIKTVTKLTLLMAFTFDLAKTSS